MLSRKELDSCNYHPDSWTSENIVVVLIQMEMQCMLSTIDRTSIIVELKFTLSPMVCRSGLSFRKLVGLGL